jgi:hypothetical protein
MVKRAAKRAMRRIKGDHPHRGAKVARFGVLLACDVILIAAAMAFLGGFAFVIVGLVQMIDIVSLGMGVALIVLSALLLILWERVFWEPFAHNLEDLT